MNAEQRHLACNKYRAGRVACLRETRGDPNTEKLAQVLPDNGWDGVTWCVMLSHVQNQKQQGDG